MTTWEQREQARHVLSREVGYVTKPHVDRVRIGLAFPNTYFVGMSNLGFQTVYRLFNADPGAVCERVFLPPKQELRELLERGTRLVTLESQTPLADLDILAFRFAGAGHEVICGHGHQPLDEPGFRTDPLLQCPTDRPDMIVGEVKEGLARFNEAMRDPAVLTVALTRFGCCRGEHVRDVVAQLLTTGSACTPSGHSVRMVAFGDVAGDAHPSTGTTVGMRHVVEFLQRYLRQHWAVLRHAQIRDPAFAVLALMEKWGAKVQVPRQTSAIAPFSAPAASGLAGRFGSPEGAQRNRETGALVYDSQPGAASGDAPTTPLDLGDIAIRSLLPVFPRATGSGPDGQAVGLLER